MILQSILFASTAILAYIGIAFFAQLSGGESTSAWSAFVSVLRPLPLVVMIVANMVFATAIYYGFMVSRFAIPMTITIGAITSFAYSVVILGAEMTITKVICIGLAILGVVLMGL